MLTERQGEEGQVALTIALMIAVASALSLSVVSRSITESSLTRIDESASRALKSAEAGIEQGLASLSLGTTTGEFGGSTYQVTVSQEGSAGFLSNGSLSNGEVAEISLSGSSGLTSIDIYWGDKDDTIEVDAAAVEVIKYQQFGASDFRTAVLTYDPNAARRAGNKFGTPTVDPGVFQGVNFAASANIPIVAQDVLVRVKVFYNKARLGFSPQPAGAQLGDQFYRISSQGVAEGSVFRQVEVARTGESLPEIFDMTLFSGTTLSQ